MGEDDDAAQALKAAFGESSSSSSSSDDELESSGGPRERCYFWEQIKQIKGLWLCRHFLSPQRQSSLLSAIHNEGWFTEASNNQAMRFGDLPAWAVELSCCIQDAVLSGEYDAESDSLLPDSHEDENLFPILPLKLLERDPLFDQLIANSYQPGQGICAHVDLLRFDDGIAIVSLESSCIMHFTPVQNFCEKGGANDESVQKVPVYLTPGSLVLMSGEARYQWKHEINRKPGFQVWEGKELDQKRRVSITLRKLRCME